MSMSKVDFAEAGAHVIGVAAVVAVDCSSTVALVGAVDSREWSIGRELEVICTETVAGCIGI